MSEHRRDFLRTVGAASAASLSSQWLPASFAQENTDRPAPPKDIPRDLQPTGSDLGSLFPDVQRIDGETDYPWSFLKDRFASLAEFERAGREKVLELLGYRPAVVQPEPEVLDRTDLGSYVREKILFSTAPGQRVPAYVLIPKVLKEKAPAIIDLHSHGGMFLFGKEKVLDLGRNHPAMTEYHQRNYDGRPTATQWGGTARSTRSTM
jgi:hypothetical protein